MRFLGLCPRRSKTPDITALEEAKDILAAAEETEHAVDAMVADHARLLKENNFGPKIAAALHLRSVR